MLNFPALDVALGLMFLYFILALVCSGINEAIASAARWRAQGLERGLWELLQDPKQGAVALQKLKQHPLIKPMLHPQNKYSKDGKPAAATPASTSDPSAPPKTNRNTDFPSYIPSRTFVSALLGFEQKAVSVAKDQDVRETLRKVDQSIKEIPSEPVQEALTALLHNAQGDAVAFRVSTEQWYDDHMERVSGWYRRRIQKVLWVLAFVLVLAVNADSLQIAKRLWVEPSVRASLVNQAQQATSSPASSSNPSSELESLPVPLGWHLASARDDPQGFPFYEKWSMVWTLLTKLVGLSLTAVAITFGAPFWFDTLSKLARLRNTGAPPPASDSVRHGEGEETRRGDSAVLAAALLQASGTNVEAEPQPAAGSTAPPPAPELGDTAPGDTEQEPGEKPP
jgi:hypothetical protein